MSNQNLIEEFTEEFLSDEANTDKESDYIIRLYQDASQETRNTVNLIFTGLCGYTLESLISKTSG